MSFIVVDTEGKDIITEIAIIDEDGDLIFEEFINKNLKDVLIRAKTILELYDIVAHYAEHDKNILEKSYKSVGIPIKLNMICSYEKSRELIKDVESYSLEFLSKSLFLQDNNKFFNKDLAHRASYDAQFTYLLYKKLLDIEKSNKNAKNINPFSSSKVDNPFQNHFDDKSLYKNEFKTLLNEVNDIKNDPNHQTKSIVILGKAGNGKTHLMMRFVQEVSKTNRFLFIGKPNDKKNISLHIYIKILESFIQKIDGSEYSQLEYLLAKSFSRIIINNSSNQNIKDSLESDPLNIYKKFRGSVNRVRNWRSIEKSMIRWYNDKYGADTLSIELLKALVKYTFYVDEHRRNLVISYLSGKELDNEQLIKIGLGKPEKDFNKEHFALSAISLFGKLSVFDEPLIISFDQLEAMSGDEELVENFVESVKEIMTQTKNSLILLNLFPSRWSEYEALFDGSVIDLLGRTKVYLDRPSSPDMRNMLIERAKSSGINLEYIFTHNIYKDILQYDSIRKVLNRANEYYQFIIHKIPLPEREELSIEEKFQQLLIRVEHLESLNKIQIPKVEKKIHFDIEEYINKVYKSKDKEYNKRTIIDDKNDIDKLSFILNSINTLYPFSLDFFKMRKVIPEHIKITTTKYTYVIGFLHLEGRTFTNRIKNFNELVINNEDFYFRLFRDVRETNIRGKVSKDEIEKLQNSPKGDFLIMQRDDRVIYETIYQLVLDQKNKDIDVSLELLMNAITDKYASFWLSKLITS
ncbi:FIG00562183: hypothetical protein [hydrothermal vent metagenome]|uniref:Exonuclease domain-containing protein n=1 Tax=hydrothermal vent metagenome TaxID=652676 RepID=A0A1W1BGL7_9ZZZZ